MTGFPLRRAILAGVLASAAVVPMIAPMPAYAQFGGIVYDPTNYAQNVLTAARSLQQINNQIQHPCPRFSISLDLTMALTDLWSHRKGEQTSISSFMSSYQGVACFRHMLSISCA